mmetsp:Transcript_19089/g.56598  ORF Transcript_19089/g.56598 Transcript_19089/m.56598 type:complete len:146 (-) Transcript_19089:94-531(-)
MWVIALLATSFTTHTNVPPALCHTTPAAAAPLAQAEEKAPPGLLSRIATRLRFRRSEDEGSLRAGTKERSMEATGAALLWQKLGAFRGGRPPSPSDEQLRDGFDALDADGDGFVTAGELRAALGAGAPVKPTSQRLIQFADLNAR